MNLDDFLQSPGLYDEMYERYTKDPKSVDPSWKKIFEGEGSAQFKDAPSLAPPKDADINLTKNSEDGRRLKVESLVNAYRKYGHQFAHYNPLYEAPNDGILEYGQYGFTLADLNKEFPFKGKRMTLSSIIKLLKDTYRGKVGYEFEGFVKPEVAQFIVDAIEGKPIAIDIETKQLIFEQLSKSELFESFMHTKFVGQKRFSLEGAETLIPMLKEVVVRGSEIGVEDFVIGMAHRGRLNVLSNILNKSYNDIFAEFDEAFIPDSFEGTGDVKYHKGFETETASNGKNIKITLTPNPSHLESVNPVVEGQAKGKQTKKSDPYKQVLPILIHGDAALAGQGVVYETLQMQFLKGYSTGGTLHFVVNNQIGFTTSPEEGRSTAYCTDIAKMFGSPIFHVNAEDPESAVFITELAVKIRQKFNIDVFIDIYGWRKYGHNETDEPAFTHPSMYHRIKAKKSIREIYRDQLLHEGAVEQFMAEGIEQEFKKALNAAKESLKLKSFASDPKLPQEKPYEPSLKGTKVSSDTLLAIARAVATVPEGFEIHPKVFNLIKDRFSMIHGEEKGIDWGMGELLAYGSLLIEGHPVRLAGQDVERGTFSHRHAIWVDQKNETHYNALNHIKEKQAEFTIVNSHLSEFAVLGFEYGYSLSVREGLTLWEAQFGDFANGAQVIIDQYIASAEQKWGQKSNLTLLLPHGYEGQGPEHSSARIERFLSLAAHNNLRIVNPSTPAQMFHVLRRQVLETVQKPLIVFTPKALLRLPACVSRVKDFTDGEFQPIIDDPKPDAFPHTLLFCSGKIYYELAALREKEKIEKVNIIRIEQLYPLDLEMLKRIKTLYPDAYRIVWVQEEPANMGAWRYIRPYLNDVFGSVEYVGRDASASPASGLYPLHKKELHTLFDSVFKDKPTNFEISGQIKA